MTMQGKTVKESSVEDSVYKVFPNDLNSHGTLFGGTVMALLDRVAAVVAERHSERLCVTASVDSLHFVNAAGEGDVLILKAAVNRTWRTSMEIGVKVMAETYRTRETKHIISAYFTFVAVDDQHKPTEVPPILPETEVERGRYEEAEFRRQRRRQESELRKARA